MYVSPPRPYQQHSTCVNETAFLMMKIFWDLTSPFDYNVIRSFYERCVLIQTLPSQNGELCPRFSPSPFTFPTLIASRDNSSPRTHTYTRTQSLASLGCHCPPFSFESKLPSDVRNHEFDPSKHHTLHTFNGINSVHSTNPFSNSTKQTYSPK